MNGVHKQIYGKRRMLEVEARSGDRKCVLQNKQNECILHSNSERQWLSVTVPPLLQCLEKDICTICRLITNSLADRQTDS